MDVKALNLLSRNEVELLVKILKGQRLNDSFFLDLVVVCLQSLKRNDSMILRSNDIM